MAETIFDDLWRLTQNQDVSKMAKLLTLCQSEYLVVLKVFICVAIVLRLSFTFSRDLNSFVCSCNKSACVYVYIL